jgi:hypothetical protein
MSAETPTHPPDPAESLLTIDYRGVGRNGTVCLTAKLGDQTIHSDKIDIVKDAARRKFAADLAKDRPGIASDDVAKQLLKIAVEVSSGHREKGDPGERAAPDTESMYSVVDGCLCRTIASRDGGSAEVPLCNFDARIIEEIVRDDGVEQTRRLGVQGTLASGEALPAVEVSTEEFARGDWPLTRWGPAAVVYAGQGNKDHLRAAMQLRSGRVTRRTVHTVTG